MPVTAHSRKPANLTIDANLLVEAKKLGINLSQAAESGISKAVAQARVKAWKRENAEALASHNEWIEKNGLPLARYRQF